MSDSREDLIQRLAKVLYDEMKDDCEADDEPLTEDFVQDAGFEYFDEVVDELTQAVKKFC